MSPNSEILAQLDGMEVAEQAREREFERRAGAVVTPSGANLPERLDDPFRLYVLRQGAELAGDDQSRSDAFALFTRTHTVYLSDRDRFSFYDRATGTWREDETRAQVDAELAARVAVDHVLQVGLAWMIGELEDELAWTEQQLAELPTGPGTEEQRNDLLKRQEHTTKRRDALKRQHAALRSRKTRETMVRDSRPLLAAKSDTFDRDPEALHTPAGLLNLRTLALREGFDPADRVTCSTAVPFDTTAEHPAWTELVEGLTRGADGKPDPELFRYLRKLLGSMLVGKADLRILSVLTGPPGTLKSTFLRLLRASAGDYIGGMGPEGLAFNANRGGANTLTPELEALVGRRGVVIDELPDEWRVNVELLKRLTGSDRLTINPKNRTPFEIKNTASLVFATNGDLRIPPGEAAAWARLYLVDLAHARAIPDDTADKHAGDRMAADPDVLRAALRFLVEGAHELLRDGGAVSPPASARQAREAMRAQSNTLAEALELEVLELDANAVTATDNLVRALHEYARETGRPSGWVPNATRLGRDLKALGCSNTLPSGTRITVMHHGRQVRAWRGIKLGPASLRGCAAASKADEKGPL
jgi:phage/plasmid-associated DNA primase